MIRVVCFAVVVGVIVALLGCESVYAGGGSEGDDPIKIPRACSTPTTSKFPFCDTSLSVDDRVDNLISYAMHLPLLLLTPRSKLMCSPVPHQHVNGMWNAGLSSLLHDDEKFPLLTARESPKGNVPRIGLPECTYSSPTQDSSVAHTHHLYFRLPNAFHQMTGERTVYMVYSLVVEHAARPPLLAPMPLVPPST